jgi:hypothetical protein
MNDMSPRGELYLRPRFQAALTCAGDTHTWADVCARLASGRAQWWSTEDQRGALITEILVYPQIKVVNYWLAAGNMAACLSLVPKVEKWAMANGCARAIGLGRPGFARVLGPRVEVVGVAYRKELV